MFVYVCVYFLSSRYSLTHTHTHGHDEGLRCIERVFPAGRPGEITRLGHYVSAVAEAVR